MDTDLGLVRHPGNDGLFRAIEMSLLATVAGQPLHFHAEGLRGTGKTTIMRAVRRVLPRIRRIKGCLYNCDPAFPHCPQHRSLSPEAVAQAGNEWVPMPFLEISHSAKVGTVVGSIDLARLVSPTQPEAALLPGTIPQAHRGILFVDEINRLAETAPELADVLLDVMGTKPGRVQIEETGLPAVELPVQVTVWAASNPDEDPGPLEDVRRQLSDRFDFVIYTDRPGDSAVVEQILATASGPWHRPLTPAAETGAELFRSRLAARLPSLRCVQIPRAVSQQVAEIYSRFHVESLRAVQAMQYGMRLVACMEQREEVTMEDLARIAPLALRHRVDPDVIKKVTAHLSSLQPAAEASPTPAAPPGKPKFPSMSFGGAAVDMQPSVPPRAEPSDHPREAGGEGAEWRTQHPPRGRNVAADSGWLSRTWSGLRRNLGLEQQQQPALRPEPSAGARRSDALQRGLSAQRPGSLFQRAGVPGAQGAGTQPAPPAASGQRGGGAQSGGTPPGAGPTSATAGSLGGQGPVQMPDPSTMPPTAPPHAARSIRQLEPHELIRTEEELGRK